MKKEISRLSEFQNRLLSKALGPIPLRTSYIYPRDLKSYNRPYQLLNILGLDEEILSRTAKETIKILEESIGSEPDQYYDDFKWKLTAFLQLQDVFDLQLHKIGQITSIFHLWYFYYESKYILIESLLCGLNGFYIASNLLLRLFLEFNLRQNYYYRLICDQRSYHQLEEYIKYAKHQNWNTVLNQCLPNDKFSKPIKFRLKTHFEFLSKASAHPYHPDLSPKQHSGFVPEPSLEGIFFWQGTRLILEAVNWVYFVNFPMLFHPVDTLKKFGFNIPVGFFIDKMIGHVIKKSMSTSDYKQFLEYSNNQESVKACLDFYNSRKNMSKNEILKSWNKQEDGKITNITEGYCKIMAKLRSMKETLSLKIRTDDQEDSEYVDKLLKLFEFHKWKDFYKYLS